MLRASACPRFDGPPADRERAMISSPRGRGDFSLTRCASPGVVGTSGGTAGGLGFHRHCTNAIACVTRADETRLASFQVQRVSANSAQLFAGERRKSHISYFDRQTSNKLWRRAL